MIVALQWIVTIGRFDINTAVMTMSGIRMAPRIVHLNSLRRIYGYLSKMQHDSIRVRTEEPDYTDLPDNAHDWTFSVYGNVTEPLPTDAPEPLGNYVTLSHYVDATLMRDVPLADLLQGFSTLPTRLQLVGILRDKLRRKQQLLVPNLLLHEYVLNRRLIFVIHCATWVCQSGTKSFMFGDNKSVVDSSMQLHAKLHKRHMMLSFHCVREVLRLVL
jgi:hypothetical protein